MSEIIGKSYNPYAMPSGGSGLASGFAMGRQIAKERGLANGVQAYVDAEANGDKVGMQKAIGLMAGVAPVETMDWVNKQKENELKRQYENELLGLRRKELENKDTRTTNMRDFEYFSNLAPEQQKQYLTLHKSGDTNINVSPLEKKRIETFASKLDENIADAQGRLNTADKGLALLNKMETGGLMGSAMNIAPDWMLSSDAQEFRSVQNQLIPQQRQAGSGTMSDADRDMYAKATISLTKDTQANKNILGIQKTVAENDIAYSQLKSMWVDQGGKTTEFDSMWRDYSNKNPIFTKDGDLNGNRADPYEWFSSGSVQETTITPEEAIAELKRRGRI